MHHAVGMPWPKSIVVSRQLTQLYALSSGSAEGGSFSRGMRPSAIRVSSIRCGTRKVAPSARVDPGASIGPNPCLPCRWIRFLTFACCTVAWLFLSPSLGLPTPKSILALSWVYPQEGPPGRPPGMYHVEGSPLPPGGQGAARQAGRAAGLAAEFTSAHAIHREARTGEGRIRMCGISSDRRPRLPQHCGARGPSGQLHHRADSGIP